MRLYDGDTFEHLGLTFRVHLPYDDASDPPWERSDGHGPVRQVFTSHSSHVDKRPGERPMHSNRHATWLYDWQEASRLARVDGWGLGPKDSAELERRLGRPAKPGEIRQEAVRKDFEFLSGWLGDQWSYIGVCVELLDDDGEAVTDKYAAAIWGVESCAEEYIAELALEMAEQAANAEGKHPEQRRKAWHSALQEARQRRYWAQRDVMTV